MLTLQKLTFKGIGRFVEEQTIDFTNLGSLIQVDGQNHNTDGSSGSGKSTIFNALDYLFGVNDLPTTVLQSRLLSDPLYVSALFGYDGKELIVKRSRSKLSISINGEVTTGSNKLAEEKLDEILAMPRNLFRPMLHKRQREGGFFLEMTPQKTYEFLTDCLGLSEMRAKLSKLDEKIDDINKNIRDATSSLDSSQASLNAIMESMEALGKPPVKSLDKAAILILKERADASLARFKTIVEDNKVEASAFESKRPKIQERQYDRSKIQELTAKINESLQELHSMEVEEHVRADKAKTDIDECNAEMYRLSRIIDIGDQLKLEATAAAMQIRSIRDCICPTCEQSWMNEKSALREKELIEKLKVYGEKIKEGDQAKIDLKSVKEKIAYLTPYTKQMETDQMKTLHTRVDNLRDALHLETKREEDFRNATFYLNSTALKDFSEHQQQMRDKHTATEDQARGQANLDSMALESATRTLESFDEAKERYNATLETFKNNASIAHRKVENIQDTLESLHGRLALAEEARRAIKSYTSASFDGSLVEISEMATRIIRHIPNMANATIQLEGLRETKDGKIKEEVNAVISIDGEIGVPIKSLSGGERSAVDLSVDLAVIDLIELRTGKGINVFILDEPFTGLDTVSIEMTLEMLKNSNLTKKLVIVDHNPEVKQMVESKLTVVRDGLTSRIEQ